MFKILGRPVILHDNLGCENKNIVIYTMRVTFRATKIKPFQYIEIFGIHRTTNNLKIRTKKRGKTKSSPRWMNFTTNIISTVNVSSRELSMA